MKTYRISEYRLVVVEKNFVTIKQKDSRKFLEFTPNRFDTTINLFLFNFCNCKCIDLYTIFVSIYVHFDVCLHRWACFRLIFDEVDANVQKLLEGQEIKYQGGHYISVSTGVRCVDFHKWYLPHDRQDPKPTTKGVVQRLNEWAKMRNIMETINKKHPSLASTVACYLQ